MGFFDDMCMVTALPVFQDPAVVFLLHREGDGMPWRPLGGPIIGERDGYGRLEGLTYEDPEKWMVSRIVQTFGGVLPQYKYLHGWSVQDPTAEGLSSFVGSPYRHLVRRLPIRIPSSRSTAPASSLVQRCLHPSTMPRLLKHL
jgi:hypothetical protein